MEKYITWFVLFLRSQLRKPTFYIQMLVYACILYVIANTKIPDQTCRVVALCTNGQQEAEAVADELAGSDSMFTFVRTGDNAEMTEMVTSGKAECGFEFCKDFDKRVSDGDIEATVKFVSSDFTTKGLVARETVFTAFYRIYGKQLLAAQGKQLFSSDDAAEKIQERYRYYLEGNKVFKVIFEQDGAEAGSDVEVKSSEAVIDTEVKSSGIGSDEEVSNAKTDGGVDYIRGTVALLIFMSLLFANREDIGTLSMIGRKKCIFVYDIASVTFQSILGFAVIRMYAGKKCAALTWYADLAYFLLFIMISCVWCRIFALIMRSTTAYDAWILPVMLACVVLCPIFFSLSEIIPAAKCLGYIFPPGMYLGLTGL